MLKKLKEYWWIGAAVGFLIAFGGHIQAIASAPQAAQKANESVQQLAESLEKYLAAQEEYKKFIDYRLNKVEERHD